MSTSTNKNNNNVIDFHERRIQKIKKELQESTAEDLFIRIQNLTHSERAMRRLMDELGILDNKNNKKR